MVYDNAELERIKSILGRVISVSEEGRISTFSAVTSQDLCEIGMLGDQWSKVQAIKYIRFCIQGNVPLRRAVSFYYDVVEQGIAIEDWERESHAEDEAQRGSAGYSKT